MPAQIDALYRSAVLLLQSRRFAESLATIEEAIAVALASSNPGAADGEMYDVKGQALAGAGRYAEAITAFERAVAMHPDTPEFMVNLADALRATAAYSAAADLYERALAIALPGEEVIDQIYDGLDAIPPDAR